MHTAHTIIALYCRKFLYVIAKWQTMDAQVMKFAVWKYDAKWQCHLTSHRNNLGARLQTFPYTRAPTIVLTSRVPWNLHGVTK